MLWYREKKTHKQKKPPAIVLAPWPYSTKTNAAVTSAYLHPQEVFFVLRNHSRLNSLMCQHLLQFLLQSKQKADVESKIKKFSQMALIPDLLNDFKRFRQCILKLLQITKWKSAAKDSSSPRIFFF